MLSTAIIIFRETLEIAMILSVVLAATIGLPRRGIWIATGFVGGLAGACMVALFASAISAFASGMGQELFNASVLFTAALIIGWTAIWMRTHARELVAELKAAGQGVREGNIPGFSLSLVIGLALLREGSEIVLFIYGMYLSHQTVASIAAGSAIGLAAGFVAGFLLYRGLIRMSARHMLNVTGWLLILLVAGLSAQGAGYLSAAGYFAGYSYTLWDTSWLLQEDGIMGKVLHSLIGYSERPTALQVSVYAATLAILFSAIRLVSRSGGKASLQAHTA
jgi:high-affinity iron transporter